MTGTEGAYYRRRQLMHQLPIYDQDPSRCRGLLENELKLMEEFIKQYKSEALGVGEVALPGQGGLPKEEGPQQGKPEGAEPTALATNGSIGDPSKEYVSPLTLCQHCPWKITQGHCPGEAKSPSGDHRQSHGHSLEKGPLTGLRGEHGLRGPSWPLRNTYDSSRPSGFVGRSCAALKG